MQAVARFYFVKNKFEKGGELCSIFKQSKSEPLKNYLSILQIILQQEQIEMPSFNNTSGPYTGCKCSVTDQTLFLNSNCQIRSKEQLEAKLEEIIKANNLYHAKGVDYTVQVISFGHSQNQLSFDQINNNPQFVQNNQLSNNLQQTQQMRQQQNYQPNIIQNQQAQHQQQQLPQQQIHTQQQNKNQGNQFQQVLTESQKNPYSNSQNLNQQTPFVKIQVPPYQQQQPTQQLYHSFNNQLAAKPQQHPVQVYSQTVKEYVDDTTPYGESRLFDSDCDKSDQSDSDNEEMNKDITSMKKKIQNLEIENKSLKKKCEKIDQIERENNKLKNEQLGLNKEIETLKNQVKNITKLLKQNNIQQ